MAIPTVVGTAGGYSAGTTTATVTPPAGSAAWIAVVYEYTFPTVSASTLIPPAGWSEVNEFVIAAYGTRLHIFRSTSPTPGTVWTYGTASGTDPVALVVAIVGYDTDFETITVDSVEDTQTSPSVTTTGEALILRAIMDGPNTTSGTVTYPTGATLGQFQQWTSNLGGWRAVVAVAHQNQATAGPTGTAVWTVPSEDHAVAYTIGLYGSSDEPVDVTVDVPASSVGVSVAIPSADVDNPTNISVEVPLSLVGASTGLPTVQVASSIDVGTPQINVQSFAPNVSVTSSAAVVVPSISVGISPATPSLVASSQAEAQTPSVSVLSPDPVVTSTRNVTISVPLAAIFTESFDPQVSTDSNVVISAPLSAVQVQVPVPVVRASRQVSVSVPVSNIDTGTFEVGIEVTNGLIVPVPSSPVGVISPAPNVSVTRHITVPVPSSNVGVSISAPFVTTSGSEDLPFIVFGPYLADRLVTGPYIDTH